MTKKLLTLCVLAWLAACSSLMPYKDQNLDYLYSIQKEPEAYKGAVVAFEGEILGVRETPERIRMILKINAPLYYYATGKNSSLAYELLLVSYQKETPKASRLAKGDKIKVLARVDGYETRDTPFGQKAGAVRLEAIALANRTTKKDLFRQAGPDRALYDSWKSGKLFFDESAKQVLNQEISEKAPDPS